MPNTPLSKVPYPSGSDAPAAAADMMALVMAMDSRMVLPAVDEADRDARYYDAPASSLVASGPSKKIWLKTGEGPTEWVTIWEDTGWIDTGFVAQSGWEISRAQGRIYGRVVDVRGQMTRTGEKIVVPSNGNFADMDLISVPPQFRPEKGSQAISGIGRATRTSGALNLYDHGMVRFLDAHANSDIVNGEYVQFTFTFLGA